MLHSISLHGNRESMADQEIPIHSNKQEPAFQNRENAPKSSDVDIEELAKEIWKLLKKNLREENERMARK